MFLFKVRSISFGMYLLCSAILFPSVSPGADAELVRSGKDVKVFSGGRMVRHAHLFFYGQEPYLSADDTAKIYKARVHFWRISNKVSLELWDNAIEFEAGDRNFKVNGQDIKTDSPILTDSKRIYIPVSAITAPDFERFSFCKTKWGPDDLSITIVNYPNVSSPQVSTLQDSSNVMLVLGPGVKYEMETQTADSVKLKLTGGSIERDSSIDINDGRIERVSASSRGDDSEVEVRLAPSSGKVSVDYNSSFRQLTVFVGESSTSTVVTSNTPLPSKPRRKINQGEYTIVVDPGHGGTDPGAIGPRRVKEKDINLILSHDLAKRLKSRGFNVILTRETDEFLPLAERTHIANENHADMFVSIHCNASISRKKEGFSIYFLSDRASDSASEAAARFENSVESLETDNAPKRAIVKELLGFLALNVHMNESSELCGLVSKWVENENNIKVIGVRQAGFNVLRGAKMPAILVETAFISNYREERKLDSLRFQTSMVTSISKGIEEYCQRANGRNKHKEPKDNSVQPQ